MKGSATSLGSNFRGCSALQTGMDPPTSPNFLRVRFPILNGGADILQRAGRDGRVDQRLKVQLPEVGGSEEFSDNASPHFQSVHDRHVVEYLLGLPCEVQVQERPQVSVQDVGVHPIDGGQHTHVREVIGFGSDPWLRDSAH